jgi:heat shock protein HslJ
MRVGVSRLGVCIAIAVSMVRLAGCASEPAPPSFAGTWTVRVPHGPTSSAVTVKIDADNTFSVSDCNVLTGKGTAAGDTFKFGPLRMTPAQRTRSCLKPPLGLSAASTAKMTGNTLTIYRIGGAKIGTLHRS